MSETVEAAGGVVVRTSETPGEDAEVLVVHRPKYDDWSLPKGKLDGGEDFLEAALREVGEETGVRCRAIRELSTIRYRDQKNRPKLVRWWLMEPIAGDPSQRSPDAEIDAARWIPVSRSAPLLTYEHDRQLVREAVESR